MTNWLNGYEHPTAAIGLIPPDPSHRRCKTHQAARREVKSSQLARPAGAQCTLAVDLLSAYVGGGLGLRLATGTVSRIALRGNVFQATAQIALPAREYCRQTPNYARLLLIVSRSNPAATAQSPTLRADYRLFGAVPGQGLTDLKSVFAAQRSRAGARIAQSSPEKVMGAPCATPHSGRSGDESDTNNTSPHRTQ